MMHSTDLRCYSPSNDVKDSSEKRANGQHVVSFVKRGSEDFLREIGPRLRLSFVTC